MKHQKLLTDIFDLLDPIIWKTAYFQELRKIILNNFPEDDITFKVSEEIYDVLREFYYPESIEVSSENLLEIETDDFCLSISSERQIYTIMLRKATEDSENITEYHVSSDIGIIEATQLKKENGICVDFNCDVYYYYGKNLSVPLDIKVNGYEDFSFSKMFGIPQILANYFRKNIKKMLPVIRYFLETNQFTELDPYLDPVDYCSFLKPFSPLLFEDFLKNQYPSEIQGYLEDIIPEYESFNDLPFEEIDYLIDDIVSAIGTDGTCVISHNIYQSICMYLLGYVDSLITQGLIVKKTDDGYHLFNVFINATKVIVIPQEASQEEIYQLYSCNPLNQEIEELKDFFSTTRGR